MKNFLVRLLLFLIVAAGLAYLLYPIAADQYMLYGNAPLLKTYRLYAAGLDAARTDRAKKAIVGWNGRQMQDGIIPLEEPDQSSLGNSQSGTDRMAEIRGGGSPGKKSNVWTALLSAANGGVTRQTITQTLERFLRAGGMIQPLRVQDPFSAESGSAASLLPADKNGVVGILEVPRIGVILPVYGERTPAHLESGLFYGPGSSLPIGGRGTHSLLAGSGGLEAPENLAKLKLTGPKLLEDMDRLEQGDLFLFSIMDQTLVYQVDRVTTAPAEQTYTLDRTISNGQMTVVSATRDGGRLIIHGKRIAPNENEEKFLQENAATIPPYWVSILVLAAPLMVFGLFTMFVTECVKRRRYKLPTEIKSKKE